MLKIDKNLCYLAGVVSGDGHLKKGVKWKGKDHSKDYCVSVHSGDKKYLEYVLFIIKEKINTRSSIFFHKRAYNIMIRNKNLHSILNKEFGIPLGKKSEKLELPKNLTKNQIKHFIAGLFDTDGGFRGNSIGFCSASKKLISELNKVLEDLEINSSIDKWVNKKYNKEYYGLKIKKSNIERFLKAIPLKNKNKLEKIGNKFMQGCRSGQTG